MVWSFERNWISFFKECFVPSSSGEENLKNEIQRFSIKSIICQMVFSAKSGWNWPYSSEEDEITTELRWVFSLSDRNKSIW